MASMLPSDIQEFKTDGERTFYYFLQNTAKPDSRYMAWYLPDINGNEPDFLLFVDQIGLIIFEVKDWVLDQIITANPQYFILNIGGREEKRTNPLKQARAYFDHVMDKLKEDPFLLSKEPEHLDKPRIPVNCGVVFPNINKYEYIESELNDVIRPDIIFFWDDIHPQSDICADKTGSIFFEKLKKMFPPRFQFSSNSNDTYHIKQLFFPVVNISSPERKPSSEGYAYQLKRLMILDHNQEAIARKFDSGHRIIVGPSGSGKTQVLACKAAFLRQYNPAVKNILFVCYNITLVNYIKRLLSDKNVPLGPDGVEVYHFFELCSKILGEEIHYEGEDSKYYETVIELTLDKLKEVNIQYDAVLVDEGQDFTDDMLQIVLNLLNKKTDSFTIALDENQNIYLRKKKWKELGIKASGRTYRLNHVYRNTKEIIDFASVFIENTQTPEDSGQLELFPGFFEYHGPKPQIKHFENFDEIASFVASTTENLAKKEGYPFSEIAVIYPLKSPEENIHIPEIISKALSSRGIISYWSAEDYRSKRSYDITTNSVTITTIHSSKGLDFACVFLVGFDFLTPGEIWTEEQINRFAYVAATRARYQLFILYTKKTPLIEKFLGQT